MGFVVGQCEAAWHVYCPLLQLIVQVLWDLLESVCSHLTCLLSYITADGTFPMGFVVGQCEATWHVYCPLLQLRVQVLWGLLWFSVLPPDMFIVLYYS